MWPRPHARPSSACSLAKGQVQALEQRPSSQSALDANKLGYQVGVRINIDVLNAQSQLYQTKRDLARAYNVLLGTLKLRQAAGTWAGRRARINSLLGPARAALSGQPCRRWRRQAVKTLLTDPMA